MTKVIRLELPYLPINKSNNLLLCVSIKSAFPPITIHCATNCISLASRVFCYWNYSLSSVYKKFYATELFSFSSQTYLTIFLNFKPKQQIVHKPPWSPPCLWQFISSTYLCSLLHLFILFIFFLVFFFFICHLTGLLLKNHGLQKKNRCLMWFSFFN